MSRLHEFDLPFPYVDVAEEKSAVAEPSGDTLALRTVKQQLARERMSTEMVQQMLLLARENWCKELKCEQSKVKIKEKKLNRQMMIFENKKSEMADNLKTLYALQMEMHQLNKKIQQTVQVNPVKFFDRKQDRLEDILIRIKEHIWDVDGGVVYSIREDQEMMNEIKDCAPELVPTMLSEYERRIYSNDLIVHDKMTNLEHMREIAEISRNARKRMEARVKQLRNKFRRMRMLNLNDVPTRIPISKKVNYLC